MSWSNVLNCTYSGSKLLNSYPPLKGKWVFMSLYGDLQTCHDRAAFKNNPLNTILIHGVYVKAELLDHPDQQKCKPKKARIGNYGNLS